MKGLAHNLSQWLTQAFSLVGEWDLFAKLIIILALLLLALAAFVRFGLSGRITRQPAWRPLAHYCFLHGLILGLLGLVLGFFRYEQVEYLAGPWIMYLYLGVVLFWLGWLGWQLRRLPTHLEKQRELGRKQQWMRAGRSKKRKKRR